jgi:6-phospho-3-hexuloisomerase
VICSRTGASKVLSYYVEMARKAKARVAIVTAVAESPVARRADVVLAIDDRPAVAARTRRGRRHGAPLGSLFEQALLVVLDQVVVDLMEALDLTEADLARIHTTFE